MRKGKENCLILLGNILLSKVISDLRANFHQTWINLHGCYRSQFLALSGSTLCPGVHPTYFVRAPEQGFPSHHSCKAPKWLVTQMVGHPNGDCNMVSWQQMAPRYSLSSSQCRVGLWCKQCNYCIYLAPLVRRLQGTLHFMLGMTA